MRNTSVAAISHLNAGGVVGDSEQRASGPVLARRVWRGHRVRGGISIRVSGTVFLSRNGKSRISHIAVVGCGTDKRFFLPRCLPFTRLSKVSGACIYLEILDVSPKPSPASLARRNSAAILGLDRGDRPSVKSGGLVGAVMKPGKCPVTYEQLLCIQ
jgi:hypothetical protein